MGIFYRSNVYEKDDARNAISLDAFNDETGDSLLNLIKLTGAPAIHTLDNVIENAAITIFGYGTTINVKVVTTVLYSNIIISKTDKIDYDYIRVFNQYKGKRIGTSILDECIKVAADLNFPVVDLVAYGDGKTLNLKNKDNQFNGYLTWANEYIEMQEVSLVKYKNKLSDFSLPYIPLHEFITLEDVTLISKADGKIINTTGRKAWSDILGFPWQARIDVAKYVKHLNHQAQTPENTCSSNEKT